MADFTKAQLNKVVKLREDGLSWTNVKRGLAEGKTGITVSGSTVRRMYDLGKGEKGAYQKFYPLAGGRRASTNGATDGEDPTPRKGSKTSTEKRTAAKAKAPAAKRTAKPSAKGKAIPKATAANTKAIAKAEAAKANTNGTADAAATSTTSTKRTARKATKAVKANADA